MSKKFIQNHPGLTAYPPRGIPANNQVGGSQNKAFGLAVIMLLVPGFLAYTIFITIWGKTLLFYSAMGLTAILLFIPYILVVKKFLLTNINEQKQYYKITGAQWLSDNKRAALQLMMPLLYTSGHWSETLEYWPATIRINNKATFKTFLPTTPEERLIELDRDWDILSEEGYHNMCKQLFEGQFSRLFAFEWERDAAAAQSNMAPRLAELTQLPLQYVMDCRKATGNRPALLLWAFDLGRIIDIARSAFMAGLITEEQAWKDILKASACIHALFTDIDDYYNNYRLGNAFWCNDFKITSDRLAKQKLYNEKCNYPIKQVLWKKEEVSILPDAIKNACQSFVQDELRKNRSNAIGFKLDN